MTTMANHGYTTGPRPGCPKKLCWKDRLDARAALLERWAAGDFTMSGTHWCPVHKGWHMTKKMSRNGTNHRYRE